MTVEQALQNVSRLFLDTAPLVYFVEGHPLFFDLAERIFQLVDEGQCQLITSPVTLAESLVLPLRNGDVDLAADFVRLTTDGPNTFFIPSNAAIATQAAQMRASYNLTLTDALQIATAIEANCDAFLTNDLDLKRVGELKILVLSELEI